MKNVKRLAINAIFNLQHLRIVKTKNLRNLAASKRKQANVQAKRIRKIARRLVDIVNFSNDRSKESHKID